MGGRLTLKQRCCIAYPLNKRKQKFALSWEGREGRRGQAKFATFVKRRLSIIREVLEVLGNRRLRGTSYTIIRIVGTIRSVSVQCALRISTPPPPSFNIRILNMVRREIGNIRDTWDGCYFGQTLDVSMTTAGSRPISFEFRVNQRDSRSI